MHHSLSLFEIHSTKRSISHSLTHTYFGSICFRNIHLLPRLCVVWMLWIVEPPGVFLNNLKLPFVTSPICFSCLCQFAGCLLFFVFFSYSTILHLMLNQTTKSIQLFNKFNDENTMHFGKITWNWKWQPFFPAFIVSFCFFKYTMLKNWKEFSIGFVIQSFDLNLRNQIESIRKYLVMLSSARPWVKFCLYMHL